MYIVTEAVTWTLGAGRSVYLAPGPRGIKEIRKGPTQPVIDTVDEDEALRRILPPEALDQLIADGKIVIVEAP